MTKRVRTLMWAGLAGIALIAIAAPPHRADITIVTHHQGDLSPQRMQAVVDLGIVGFSFLLTWSKQLAH
ncbi:hypothetical protein [Sphingomonas xinjiangensis]|uniref:Uncharacterized protein n=1 Tax=Sphingomonas xinjiangensis TaxID=643568 RepID=A0A840YKL0_9SPHN|nr:hypothetical protein [Sphingomonas xinjiangensis]MBB5709726.1 hypothetical protein [Sphingomonas xinjiangensis]